MARAADGARPRQLPLDLETPPRLGAADFLVAPSNGAAHALIMAWPAWPDRALLLEGPAGAGKTHLAAIWAARSGAAVISGPDLSRRTVASLGEGAALAVDGVDAPATDEQALFHLLNAVREQNAQLLLTARQGPSPRWPALADLASRLRGVARVTLLSPDESMIRAVLVKLLHDRQLAVDASVVEYLARRIERSLAAARTVVAELDREAIAQGRRVTRGMAGAVLARCGGEEPDEDAHG